jgi:hypothetical protein
VRVEPSTVQTKKANLRFFAMAKTDIPADVGWIRISVPDDIKVYKLSTGVGPLYCLDKQADPPASCEVKYKLINNRNTFEIISTRNIGQEEQFDFIIGNAIDNPMSMVPTDAFPISTSSGSTYTGADIYAMQATAGPIREISFIPESKVVGASTTLVVKFTPSNTIPKGGSIRMEFPKWNHNAKVEDQKSYIQGAESCQDVLNLHNGLSCRLVGKLLIIENIAPGANISSGTPVSFKIKGFKNPIETGKHGGFKIRT